MKNIIAVCAFFALTGCSTVVPVKAKFPDMPERLMVKCPQLEKVSETPTLSDVAKTVTNNYTTYYECATKHDGFVEWYNIQKNIFESIK
jgi:hypothetical protein